MKVILGLIVYVALVWFIVRFIAFCSK